MNKWLLTAGLLGTATQAFAVADTTAPSVTSTVKPGTYTVAQSVKLAILDNVDKKPNLYYTTDGSAPSIRSKLYRGETIAVTDTNSDDAAIDMKIRTLAMDINGNYAGKNFYYRIKTVDTVAPTIAATPAGGTYASAQNVVLKVSDNKDKAPKLYYTVDGTTPTTSSALYKGETLKAVDKGDGVDLKVRTLAVDVSGNKSTRNFYYYINGENNPPSVAVSPAPGEYNVAQSVRFDLSDDTDQAPKLYYTLDGSKATASSTLYTAPIVISKDTVINTYAVDATGKSVSASYSYEISTGGIGDGYLLDQFVAPGISIYVKTGWGTTNLHSFNVLPAGVSADTKWPGNKMSDAGNGWTTASFPGASSVSVVFNNGSGTQYPTGMGKETRTESGCLDLASKVWTGMADCPAPIEFGVNASVPSGSYGSDELEVTLSIMGAAADATGYLTLNGTAPSATNGLKFKNGQKLMLGKNTAVGKEIKLWLSAEGKEATYTYTKAEKKDVTVQIYAPEWSSANAHYFNVTPSSISNSVWPGATMAADADNKGWFKYTLPGAEVASFVFNQAGEVKALDFVGAKSGCYNVTAGSVPTATDCPVQVAAPSASPAGGDFNGESVNVTLSYSGKNITAACYTLDGTDPSVSCKDVYAKGTVVPVGKTLAVGASQTLKLYAKNDLGEMSKEYKFTKQPDQPKGLFTWDNATVYFVLTDRFRNGDLTNDHSYGRECPKSAYDKMTGKVNTAQCWSGYEKREGNFRGGDLKGMLDKLNAGYFTDLGVNAIWLSVPFEQIHGYVGGENFKYYGYHGYWAADMTNVDANLGDKALMKEFIDAAHNKGIRIIFDVAINHLGYDTMQDADEYGFGAMNPGWENYYYTSNNNQANYKTYGPYFNYGSSNWGKWWGSDWVRAKAYGTCTASDDINMCLDGLPDVRGEASNDVGLPPYLVTKWTREGRLATEQASLDAFFQKTGLKRTPANYMIKWLTDWVREYGVDGFRCDTAKHIQLSVWKELKTQANVALKEWRAKPGVVKPDSQDLNFWMTAEVYDFAIGRPAHNTYHDNGFDSVINFEFQGKVAGNIAAAESNFSSYANAINSSHTWNVLNYISSHDTSLHNRSDLINAGTTLLLSPGAAQIYYGDETARPIDPYGPHWNEKFRSNMNWCDGSLGSDLSPCVNDAVLKHWQKLGQFRNKHPAIGAGSHAKISDSPYTFVRDYKGDKVVVAFASGQQTINVGSAFAEGAAVMDFYTGTKATVSGGKVSLNAGGVVLLEKQ